MKLSTREDVSRPAAEVFAHLTDFDRHERTATRRGIKVIRRPGPSWTVEVPGRGRVRRVELVVDRSEPDDTLAIGYTAEQVQGTFTVELVALSATRTRVLVAVEIRPRNLSGRLLVQSLRLVKSRLNRRFRQRVRAYARGAG